MYDGAQPDDEDREFSGSTDESDFLPLRIAPSKRPPNSETLVVKFMQDVINIVYIHHFSRQHLLQILSRIYQIPEKYWSLYLEQPEGVRWHPPTRMQPVVVRMTDLYFSTSEVVRVNLRAALSPYKPKDKTAQKPTSTDTTSSSADTAGKGGGLQAEAPTGACAAEVTGGDNVAAAAPTVVEQPENRYEAVDSEDESSFVPTRPSLASAFASTAVFKAIETQTETGMADRSLIAVEHNRTEQEELDTARAVVNSLADSFVVADDFQSAIDDNEDFYSVAGTEDLEDLLPAPEGVTAMRNALVARAAAVASSSEPATQEMRTD
jgi:hypothetical protein